jgi:uncharacterized protein YceK
MQQLRTERLRSVVVIVALVIGPTLLLSGCGSDEGGTPTQQAQKGQAAARSSMDFMKKQLAEAKVGKSQSKPAPKGR